VAARTRAVQRRDSSRRVLAPGRGVGTIADAGTHECVRHLLCGPSEPKSEAIISSSSCCNAVFFFCSSAGGRPAGSTSAPTRQVASAVVLHLLILAADAVEAGDVPAQSVPPSCSGPSFWALGVIEGGVVIDDLLFLIGDPLELLAASAFQVAVVDVGQPGNPGDKLSDHIAANRTRVLPRRANVLSPPPRVGTSKTVSYPRSSPSASG